jgi:hypothetical protein
MKLIPLPALALVLILTSLSLSAENAYDVRDALNQEADFEVLVYGIHTEKFQMGLFDFDTETKQRKHLRIPREGTLQFFKNQKHKGMILVRYYTAPIDDWDHEIERTVKFFQEAGYGRVVLLQEYGQIPGITVVYDTSGRYAKQQFIKFGEPKKQTKPEQPTPATPEAGPACACGLPAEVGMN